MAVLPPGHPEREENKARFLEGNHPEVPDVVYHGTPEGGIRQFAGHRKSAAHVAFDPEYAKDFTQMDYLENGYFDYVGDNEEWRQSGPQMYPLHVSAKKVFDARDPKHLKMIGENENTNPKAITYEWLERRIPEIKKAGFDSYFDFEEGTHERPQGLAVFRPHQIKSATGNQGTFDPENPDITKAEGGEVGGWNEYAEGGAVTDYEPQRTVKGYKLFRIKRSQPGKLFPLFVNPNKEVPVGQWLEAEEGPQGKKQGKVKSRLGDLAYRPGWHAGDLPIATHIGGKSDNKLKAPDYRPPDQVWAEIEMLDDVDWQSIANSRMQFTKDGEPRVDTAHITDQIPFRGFYRYKTNPNMTGNWLIGGHVKVNRILSDDEVQTINAAAGTADLPRLEPSHAESWDKFAQGGEVFSPIQGVEAYHEDPAFQEWFGNSVTHREGVPVTYYTGTSKDTDFNKFNVGRHGSWFTADPSEASEYAFQNDSQGYKYEGQRFIKTNTASRVIPAHLKIENPYTGPIPPEFFKDNYKAAQSKFFDILRSKGHDGWIPAEHGGKLAVVLKEPHQIKTVNNRTWDPKNPRMDKAGGGEVEDEGITAYHGSPHDFDEFDLSKIGTGEGVQMYGHGLYFAENEDVAKGYRNKLGFGSGLSPEDTAKRLLLASNGDREAALETARQAHERAMQSGYQDAIEHARSVRNIINTQPEKALGRMYEVRINAHPDHFLDWDKPLEEQSQFVQEALRRGPGEPTSHGEKEFTDRFPSDFERFNGYRASTAYTHLAGDGLGQYMASEMLKRAGIKGIRYLDAGSRGAGEGSHNYVVFDDKLVNVKRKYADGGVVKED